MSTSPKTSDSGIWKRGVVLFVAMFGIAGVVLFIALRRPSVETVEASRKPERLAHSVAISSGGFPGHVNWGALYLLSEELPSPKGWETRYNAVQALARRGSENLPLHLLCEMLDERRQMINWRVPTKTGKYVVDEAAARRTVLTALVAFDEWHEHSETVKKIGRENADLLRVYAAVEKLTRSENNVIQTEARNLYMKIKPS